MIMCAWVQTVGRVGCVSLSFRNYVHFKVSEISLRYTDRARRNAINQSDFKNKMPVPSFFRIA